MEHDDVWSGDAACLLRDRKRALRPEAKNVKNVATAAQPTAPAHHKQTQAERRKYFEKTLKYYTKKYLKDWIIINSTPIDCCYH